MSLINRLAGIGTEETGKLSPDHFWALLYEMAQGKVTQAQIAGYLTLDAQEQTELTWVVGRYNAQPNATAKARFVEVMRAVLMLAESQTPGYATNADIVARINAI